MKEIINEFFSKECKRENKTIDELLKEYEIDERLFWNYVYTLNPIIVAKIKEENKRRQKNKKSLEIYRLLKDGTLTFGDVARIQKTTVDAVVELLQNEYLVKGISQYSFDKLDRQNTKLLKQKKELHLYFYFIEHKVTFSELGKQFGIEEVEIIYLFDAILDSELTEEQIRSLFVTNKKREKPNNKPKKPFKMNENKKCLYKLFALTEAEETFVDSTIERLKEESPELHSKNITTLNYIKMRLTGDMVDTTACCDALKVNPETMRGRLNQLSKRRNFSTIITKIFILNMINGKKIYTHPEIAKIEYYMKFYADYLNNPNLTISDIELQHKINLRNGNLIDQKLNTHIFSIISDKIEELEENQLMNNFDSKVYEYYKNHFVLFRDLGPLLGIEQEELQQNFPVNQNEWRSICEIEEKRIKHINDNIKRITYFSKLLSKYQIDNDNNQIYDNLITLIGENRLVAITGKQKSYTERLIRSILFTCDYIQQENYDTKKSEQLYNIKSPNTVHKYLYHSLIIQLLDSEVVEYIRIKRKISENCKRLENFQKLSRDEKGQFVKKYQVSEVTD